jgi:L-aminopeptidase/D-esterase-like protein
VTRVYEYDFGEFEVGTCETADETSGVTLLSFPAGAQAVVDARGGAICSHQLSALALDHPTGQVDGIVLCGGGAAGLAACAGVYDQMVAENGRAPVVVGAATRERSAERITAPDAALGANAYAATQAGRLSIGRAGAGIGCTVGGWFGPAYQSPAGQGAAQFTFANLKVFALSVVNALGNVVGDQGQIVRGVRRTGGGYDAVHDRLAHALGSADKRSLPESTSGGNTTLTVVVTNLHLDRHALHRLAVMAHGASARVIDPLWGPDEGDTLFVVSTRSVRPPDDLRLGDLGVVAGRVVRQAILSAVA